jgi:hypothetical protein
VRLAILLLLILAMAACAAGPRIAEPPPTGTPWCFALRFSFDGKDESAVACSSSLALCANAQRRAVTWGGAIGAKEVGLCRAAR